MKHDQNQFALVDFHDTQLLTFFDGETVRVAMKHVCEAIGVDWSSQRQKIIADPVLSKGVVLSTIPSERGTQETLTLPLDLMHGWLFKLNADRVKPEIKERVIAFQKECYQVLHDYWMKGAAINPRFGAPAAPSTSDLIRTLDRLEKERQPDVRAMLHAKLTLICEQQGITPAPLEAIGFAAPSVDEVCAPLFAALDELDEKGVAYNHHRKPALLALHLPSLAELFEEHRIPFLIDGELRAAMKLHPAFCGTDAVNCKDGKSRHCWVFRLDRIPPAPK